jgi:hypothetical protein
LEGGGPARRACWQGHRPTLRRRGGEATFPASPRSADRSGSPASREVLPRWRGAGSPRARRRRPSQKLSPTCHEGSVAMLPAHELLPDRERREVLRIEGAAQDPCNLLVGVAFLQSGWLCRQGEPEQRAREMTRPEVYLLHGRAASGLASIPCWARSGNGGAPAIG